MKIISQKSIDNTKKLIENGFLTEEIISLLGSFVHSDKIKSGNEKEKILCLAFNKIFANHDLKNCRAENNRRIENTNTRKNYNKIDVAIIIDDKIAIAIDVKNGSDNGTDSPESRAQDVISRVEITSKYGCEIYAYLATLDAPCKELSHVKIAKNKKINDIILISGVIENDNFAIKQIIDLINRKANCNIDQNELIDNFNTFNTRKCLDERFDEFCNKLKILNKKE